MKAFECTGHWWVPEDEQHGAAGTLKVSETGELRLWLVGTLGAPVGFGSKTHSRILGWVDKSPFGDKVTLAGCVLGGSSFGPRDATRENYIARRGFFGAHLTTAGDFAFKSTSFQIAGLSEWAQDYSGFGDGRLPGTAEEKVPLLTYAYRNPLDALVPGGRVSLTVGMRKSERHREHLYQEEVSLSVQTDSARSADELNLEFVYPLQNLMTFVSDRAQEVEDFTVRAGELPSNLMGGDIQVIGARVQPETEDDKQESVHHFQMLFTLADVSFPEFIGAWLGVTARFAAACNVFFGVQYGPSAFIDMMFPYIVQSLYLYHLQRDEGVAARAQEESRLKEIVTRLVPTDADWLVDHLGARPFPALHVVLKTLVDEHAQVMNPLVSKRRDRFVSEVVNTLKYATFREAEMVKAASHGADLYWMMQKLRFLFKSCLMNELGFAKDKGLMLFERNALYKHVCHIEEAEERARQKV